VLASWHAERPRDVALAPDASIYVFKGARQSIEVHALDGKYLRSLPGNWQDPSALAFNSRHQQLVLDAGAWGVSLLRLDGSLISSSDPDAGLRSPRGMALDANDDVYVADTGNAAIYTLTLNCSRPKAGPPARRSSSPAASSSWAIRSSPWTVRRCTYSPGAAT